MLENINESKLKAEVFAHLVLVFLFNVKLFGPIENLTLRAVSPASFAFVIAAGRFIANVTAERSVCKTDSRAVTRAS